MREPLTSGVILPRTDLSVSRLSLGGNRFGSELDDDATAAMLDRYVELGGTLVDTAHVYADWLPDVERSCSEKAVGRWLRRRGGATDGLVVATKGAHPDLADETRRLDPDSIRADAVSSCENLGLSTLPLFYLHRDDPDVPVPEILGALEDLRHDGVLAHYAASNWSAARLREAAAHARAAGFPGFVAHQAAASLAAWAPGARPADMVAQDTELDDLHVSSGLALVAYTAQAKGYFDKLVRDDVDEPSEYDVALNRETGALLAAMAGRHGVAPVQLALRSLWLLPYPVVAVVGPRTVSQLESSWAALGLALSEAEEDQLRERLGLVLRDQG